MVINLADSVFQQFPMSLQNDYFNSLITNDRKDFGVVYFYTYIHFS